MSGNVSFEPGVPLNAVIAAWGAFADAMREAGVPDAELTAERYAVPLARVAAAVLASARSEP